MEAARTVLADGLASLKLDLEAAQIESLLGFAGLLQKWSKAYNLTAIRGAADIARLHLLDSLAVARYVTESPVLDVGTGAGLPGLPLAVALPATEFVLLDANAKKTRFIRQAVLELKLNNVAICRERVEHYRPPRRFRQIISRAFADLPTMIRLTRHLLAEDGTFLAMKGRAPGEEMARIGARQTLIPIRVPGVEAERCLVKIESVEHIEAG